MKRGTDRFPPLNALRAFEAVARHLSFKKAAVELHVTAGAVSAQVKILEEHLGVPLFRRLTRALELTGEGQTLLPKVSEGLETLRTAVERLRIREARATLTVVAPPNFAARWLVPRLQGFTSQHPELELHVASRQSMVDGGEPTERFVEAREDAPTVAIRFGSGHYAASRVDEIFPAPMRAAMVNALRSACGSAIPRPVMSYAVPWAGVVIATGRPPCTVTPRSNPISFIAIWPWS